MSQPKARIVATAEKCQPVAWKLVNVSATLNPR